MSPPRRWPDGPEARSRARPLVGADLDPLVDPVGGARFVCIDKASHGTNELYPWQAIA